MSQDEILQGWAKEVFSLIDELDEVNEAAIADGLTERRAEDLLARSDVISMRLRRYLDKLRRTQAAPTNQTRPALGLETRA